MLILTRREGESIVIAGNIRVTVLDTRGDHVRIGIDAPRSVTVHRAEIDAQIRGVNEGASHVGADDVRLVPRVSQTTQNPAPKNQRFRKPL